MTKGNSLMVHIMLDALKEMKLTPQETIALIAALVDVLHEKLKNCGEYHGAGFILTTMLPQARQEDGDTIAAGNLMAWGGNNTLAAMVQEIIFHAAKSNVMDVEVIDARQKGDIISPNPNAHKN